MNSHTHRIRMSAFALLLLSASFAAVAAPPSPTPTGKPWLDMDYGPFLTATVEAGEPAGNFAYKGIVIRIGPKESDTVVFDTDTLRYSAGWRDGYITMAGVVFDGAHWAYPKTPKHIAFTNGVGPGCAKPGETGEKAFADPRFKGRDGKPYGPLPRDWAHWKGLYLHDNHVVLSYTVGKAQILESPSMEALDGQLAFARTLHVRGHEIPLGLRVCDKDARPVKCDMDKGMSWIVQASAEPAKALAPDKSLEEGLVAHWSFDEANEGRIANLAGKDFAATDKNARLGEGRIGKAIELTGKSRVKLESETSLRLGRRDYTIAAWIRTSSDGTILSRAPAEGGWKPQGRSFFVRAGKLVFDVGWVGQVQGNATVSDGKWHHVAASFEASTNEVHVYVDGRPDGRGKLDVEDDDADHITRIGYTSTDFPSADNRFKGAMDDLRIYTRVLSLTQLAALAQQAAGGDDDALVVACVADPEKAVLSASDSQVHLTIAPSKEPSAVKLLTWRGDRAQLPTVLAALKNVKPAADLTPWTRGGPPRWREKLTTKAELGKPAKNLPWVVDTLTWPAKNPWNAWMRFGGFDFFKDGSRAAACTWNGDVWIVSGIKPGEDLGELTWQRIATGLFQPLGLRIVDDQIYVCGRDQITRLVDLNGDGETDFYENFNNDHQVTEHFHEFAMGLQTDDEGNFYYAKSGQHARDSLVEHHGTLLKVSKDGATTEILANGYRAANGVGVGPGGTFFTSDQEGFWMPANRINLVERGSFSGNMFSYHRGKVPTDYDRPIVWLPKGFDRSPAEQVWVRDDRWGLPKDSIISLSYGTGQILSVIHEPVKGVEHVNAQGAAFRLGLSFPTGIMRGRFHPGDGQLYACGLFGWSSDRAASPGGLWRVRYTGAKVHVPAAFRVVRDGVILRFTHPLDRETATDAGSYQVEQWNYQWTKNYGSPEFKVSDGQKGRDTLKPRSVTLSKDGRSVLLSFADFKPSMQLRIKYELDAADGSEVSHDVYGSVFVVPAMEGATVLDTVK